MCVRERAREREQRERREREVSNNDRAGNTRWKSERAVRHAGKSREGRGGSIERHCPAAAVAKEGSPSSPIQ